MVKRTRKTSGTIWRSVFSFFSIFMVSKYNSLSSSLRSGVQGRLTQTEEDDEGNAEENKSDGDAMEE